MALCCSFEDLVTLDPGFRPAGLLTLNIDFNKTPIDYVARLFRDGSAPFKSVDGAPAATGKSCYFSQPGPGYFKTMGITALARRDLTERDTPDSPHVAIVNEKFAHTFLGGRNPIGHVFHMAADAGRPEPKFQVVGLVRDTKYHALREDFLPIAYFQSRSLIGSQLLPRFL